MIAGIAWFFLSKSTQQAGESVTITVDGSCYGTYSLDSDREIEIKSENGRNVVVIEAGEIYMKEADCPDRYCMKQGKISGNHESIVCLPHKLIVEVEAAGEDKEQLDAVTH